MSEYFIGAVVGLIGALFLWLILPPFNTVKRDYRTCISDGGTQSHCVDKYVLGKSLEEKP